MLSYKTNPLAFKLQLMMRRLTCYCLLLPFFFLLLILHRVLMSVGSLCNNKNRAQFPRVRRDDGFLKKAAAADEM